MATHPTLGPVALCVLAAVDGAAAADAYCRWLHQRVVSEGPLEPDIARGLGIDKLADAPSWLLANEQGRSWLLVVEAPQAAPRDSLLTHGWLAQELLVADVDGLVASLEGSPFTVLRPPANLDIPDDIRASQVRGPAGEILYLTQVNSFSPPIQLPRCTAPVDHLFIPVLSTPSREESLRAYAALAGSEGFCFETRISVVNQAMGLPLEQRHPIATIQLAGEAMIELDQIAGARPSPEGLTQGTLVMVFEHQLAPPEDAVTVAGGAMAGWRLSPRRGVAGERYALLHTST